MLANLRAAGRRTWWTARVRPGRLAGFGAGSVIVPPATVLCPDRIEIGRRVLVFEHVTFSLVRTHWGVAYEPRLRIGDGTVVARDAWFSCVGEIEIGADVLIGPGVLIADSLHGYGDPATPVLRAPMAAPLRALRIGDGAHLGAGCAVMAGVRIGAGATVLPRAVVWSDVPDGAVAAGDPAEVIVRPQGEGWWESSDPRWAAAVAALRRARGG